jgi:hypothetical protein
MMLLGRIVSTKKFCSKNHLFAPFGAQRLEHVPRLAKILPLHWQCDRFQVRDRLYLVWRSPVKSQGGSPIVNGEGDIARKIQCFEPGIDVARVIDKPIGLSGRLSGLTDADRIRRKASLPKSIT